jgi:uncharacterized phiE125 gp8 family phage protein
MNAPTVITPCQYEPVSVDDMMLHSRVDSDAEYSYLEGLVMVARRYVEQVTRRVYMPAVLEWTLDAWPSARYIEVESPPLRAVESVKYVSEAGSETVFNASNYIVDTAPAPGQIWLRRDASWPSETLRESGAIKIRYTAGYSDVLGASPTQAQITAARSAVPINVRHAIKLIAAHLYENREQVVAQVGLVQMAQLPLGVDALLASERVYGW